MVTSEGRYRFVGPQGPVSKNGKNKGVMRALKLSKRQEAEQRQKLYNSKTDSELSES